MPNLYIFDLDGVLFDNSHRQHLLPTGDGQTTEQWDAFNQACEDDEPIHHMWSLLFELTESGHRIHFLTGRSEVCRAQTINAIWKAWASRRIDATRSSVIDNILDMRPVDDHRRAAEFKYDSIKHIADVIEATAGPMVELILIDDDPSIIEACSPLVDRTILVKPFSGCAAIAKASARADIENWEIAAITAATHYHGASGSLMWLDDGFTSARIWVGGQWLKTRQPAPSGLLPITSTELLLRALNTNK